jgi:predicted metalloprotease
MRWDGRRGSDNIEDRRGDGGGGFGGPPGGMRMGRIGGAGGFGLIAVAILVWALGGDPIAVLTGGTGGQTIQVGGGGGGGQITPEDEQAAKFVSVTLADTEEVWKDVLQKEAGMDYTPTTLVLFKGQTYSDCGGATEATGPFYCPVDKKVYLDTDFFTTMSQELGAKGDFAAAYVVAHEVGHHVQDLLGILDKTTRYREQASEADANAMSVRVELQADCFAGVWAKNAAQKFGSLEPGDIQEAVDAASRIGDDTLQRNAGRRPMPDSFTHGTSEQRQRWLTAGYNAGTIRACDTFGTNSL